MIHLEIHTRNTQPLRQALYGFNTNMMSGDYGYLDPDFVELTKTLAPKTLRFPVVPSETFTIGKLVVFLRMNGINPQPKTESTK